MYHLLPDCLDLFFSFTLKTRMPDKSKLAHPQKTSVVKPQDTWLLNTTMKLVGERKDEKESATVHRLLFENVENALTMEMDVHDRMAATPTTVFAFGTAANSLCVNQEYAVALRRIQTSPFYTKSTWAKTMVEPEMQALLDSFQVVVAVKLYKVTRNELFFHFGGLQLHFQIDLLKTSLSPTIRSILDVIPASIRNLNQLYYFCLS